MALGILAFHDMDFAMDTAIITGTTRGLGKSLGEQFAASGWNVVPLNRPQFDLRSIDHGSIAKLLASVDREGGRTILVNNAASLHIEATRHMLPETVSREIETNVTGPIALISTFLRVFPRGEIVNITSVAASSPLAHWSLYGTAKAALDAFVEHLRVEGVKCFNLNPGAVATDMQVAIAASSSPLPMGTLLRSPDAVAKNLVWQIVRG